VSSVPRATVRTLKPKKPKDLKKLKTLGFYQPCGASAVFVAGHAWPGHYSRISKGSQHIDIAYEQRLMSSEVSNAFYCIKVKNQGLF